MHSLLAHRCMSCVTLEDPRCSVRATRGLSMELSPYGSLVMQHLSHESLKNGHRVIEYHRVIVLSSHPDRHKQPTPEGGNPT
eukprot:s111_g55.t1